MPQFFLFFLCGFMRSLFLAGTEGAYFFCGRLRTFLMQFLSAPLLSPPFPQFLSSCCFSRSALSACICAYLASQSCFTKLLISCRYSSLLSSLSMQIPRTSGQLSSNPSLTLICSLSLASAPSSSTLTPSLNPSTKCLANTSTVVFTFMSCLSLSQQGRSIFSIQILSVQSVRYRVQQGLLGCFLSRSTQSRWLCGTMAVVLSRMVSSTSYWLGSGGEDIGYL